LNNCKKEKIYYIDNLRVLLIVLVVLILIGFPLLFVIKLISGNSNESFAGGGTYQSFILATWEQVIGISIMVVLLGYGSEKWNRQSALLKNMSRSAYAV
jgi:glucan biosynthesis protein C